MLLRSSFMSIIYAEQAKNGSTRFKRTSGTVPEVGVADEVGVASAGTGPQGAEPMSTHAFPGKSSISQAPDDILSRC